MMKTPVMNNGDNRCKNSLKKTTKCSRNERWHDYHSKVGVAVCAKKIGSPSVGHWSTKQRPRVLLVRFQRALKKVGAPGLSLGREQCLPSIYTKYPGAISSWKN